VTALTTDARAGASRAVTSSRSRKRRNRRQGWTVLALLSPGLIGLGVFTIYPLLANIFYSFTHFDLINPAHWAGLANYRFMFSSDPQVGRAIENTLYYMVIAVPLQLLFGLGVALVMARVKRGASFYRTLFYLPTLLPPVAATLAFVFVLNPATGPVDTILGKLHLPQPLWFSDPHWSKPSLILLSLWGVGNTIIIMLASRLDVPLERYEAASLDGAGAWSSFRAVTLPAMAPVLLFRGVTGAIIAMQLFTEPYVAVSIARGTTSFGFPQGSTMFYSTWLYEQGFEYFNMGYAAALSVVLFAASLVVIAVIVRVSRSIINAEAEGS
jgi:multiple sugar transport system permease protein